MKTGDIKREGWFGWTSTAQRLANGYSGSNHVHHHQYCDEAHRMIELPSQRIPDPTRGRVIPGRDAPARRSSGGNLMFRAAREGTSSQSTPGYCMSRAELAEAVNEYLRN